MLCFVYPLYLVFLIFKNVFIMFYCFSQALDLTVQLMEMGEKALIETKAKYAYGALGR